MMIDNYEENWISIAEAAEHGWTDYIPLFDKANICFGTELYELAKSMDRWKELSELKSKK